MMRSIVKQIKKLYLSIPALLILVIVLGGFIVNCFVSNTFLLDNRPLAKKPDKLTSHFARDFEQYYNDTFAGRKKLVKKFSKIKLKLGLDTGFTINGLNGWMFYDSAKVPDGYTLVDYYGEIEYTPEELQQIAEGLKKAKAYYAKRGIDYIIAVVPNKEGLYSEYMPERMQKARISDISRSDKAIKYVQDNTDVDVINWREILMETKQKTQYLLYFQQDSHWNNIGAYVAYTKLAEVLRSKGYLLDVPFYNDAMVKRSYASRSDLSIDGADDTDYDLDYKPSQMPKNIIDEDHGFFQIWENPTAQVKKRVMLNRDSMGIALMQYMKKDFIYGLYVHNKWNTKEGLEKLISTYHPDLVIEEIGERYFGRFLKYNTLYGEK